MTSLRTFQNEMDTISRQVGHQAAPKTTTGPASPTSPTTPATSAQNPSTSDATAAPRSAETFDERCEALQVRIAYLVGFHCFEWLK